MHERKLSALVYALTAALAFAAANASAGRITLYENAGFSGRNMSTADALADTERSPFRDVASSIVVADGAWEACTEVNFGGRCARLVPGGYAQLSRQLDGRVASVRELPYESGPLRVVINPDAPAYVAAPIVNPPVVEAQRVVAMPAAQLLLFQNPNFAGLKAVIDADRSPDLDWAHFTNPATSARVVAGTWQLCTEIGYQGDCRVLGPGEYPTLTGVFANGVYSARQVYPPQLGSADRYYRP